MDLEPFGGATNANGWVYGLFELAFVLAIVLAVTMPFWAGALADRLRRYFASHRRRD